MSHLLDVSFLLACGWGSHGRHKAARLWLERRRVFTTCPLAELGFLRVSMTPGFKASFEDSQTALADITSRSQARRILEDVSIFELPHLTGHAEVTDAYLVALARAHGLKLATLDESLCKRTWAVGIAENPL